MGIQVKHVVVVASIFSVVGFGYVVGFGEIDAVRSPRAGALGVRASMGQLIGNARVGMATGQERGALTAVDSMVELYPENPQGWLYRGLVYRSLGGGGGGGEGGGQEGVEAWERLLGLVGDVELLSGRALAGALYQRGWAYRGLGRMEESRGDFLRLAEMSGEGLDGVGGVGGLYNLACYWALAGEIDRAMEYWKGCVEGGYDLGTEGGWWRVDPDFEDLRLDTRFWEFQKVDGG